MARGLMPKPPHLSPRLRNHRFDYLDLTPPARLSAASATWLRQHARHLANVREDKALDKEVCFSRSSLRLNNDPLQPDFEPTHPGGGDRQPPSERTLKLGKTIRILHERLPTLLVSPLPPDILSPQINLHLFPSTHPHLPSVRGKIAYSAALWTAPVAWGRFPLVGNVKLIIISERMIKNGTHAQLYGTGNVGAQSEELIVRWRTCGKNSNKQLDPSQPGQSKQASKSSNPLDQLAKSFLPGAASSNAVSSAGEEAEEFCGLFIFSFDSEGRILSHTIEHTQQGGNWEKMTSRVINVTDWLLGRAKWRRVGEGNPEEGLALGYSIYEPNESDVRWRLKRQADFMDRRGND